MCSKRKWDVPLWSEKDVQEWINQIGFGDYELNFQSLHVDGDLLLQINETNLKDDIGIENGIMRQRFKRELDHLKKKADYRSLGDTTILKLLESIGPDFIMYTYAMMAAGIDKESLKNLSEDQLIMDCGIENSIHRARILKEIESLKGLKNTASNFPKNSVQSPWIAKEVKNLGSDGSDEEEIEKIFDVFISCRENGFELASLLKKYLNSHGQSVFLDGHRSKINTCHDVIRKAKNFVLILSAFALDLCIDDHQMIDLVHKVFLY